MKLTNKDYHLACIGFCMRIYNDEQELEKLQKHIKDEADLMRANGWK